MTPTDLRTILQHLGLEQPEVAAVLGVSERAVRAWLSGFRNVPIAEQKLLRLMRDKIVTAEQVMTI
jgi:DNA-binding transcriptional regulator YiaG